MGETIINTYFLEKLYELKLLPAVFASLISSDTLVDADACSNSLFIFNEMKSVFPNTSIPESAWKKFVDEGINIARNERYKFLSADNDEYDYGHDVKIQREIFCD